MSLPETPTLPRCYRHPDREGGRSCTRCGRPACSDCLVQASIGSHCLDCAKASLPDVKTRVKLANSRVLTPATDCLVAVNVAVFLWLAALDTNTLARGLTAQHSKLALNRSIVYYTHEWYRIITSGFIHFGIIHIAFNMLLLVQLGNLIERALGPVKFVMLYFACLLGGAFGVLLLDGTKVVGTGGASGAVFGLMGAAAVGLHRRNVNVFSTSIGSVLLLNLVFTFTIPGVSIGGHLGGVVAGAICGWFVLAPQWKPLPKWAGYAAPAAVALVSAIGCYWAVTSLPVFTR